MINNNSATELCIIKEQEGIVAGWQSAKSPHRKLILNTLLLN